MGSFDTTTSGKAAASIKSSHADQIEGAAPAAARTTSSSTPGHTPNAAPNAAGADRIGAGFADATSFTPSTTSAPDDFFTFPDPARSPFLNPPSAQGPAQATPTLPPPPALPPRPGSLEDFGGGRQAGNTDIIPTARPTPGSARQHRRRRRQCTGKRGAAGKAQCGTAKAGPGPGTPATRL